MKVLKIALGLSLSLLLMGGLTACADKSKETQSSVDTANNDLKRLGEIDEQLQDNGVYISSKVRTRKKLAKLEEEELLHIQGLVTEFIAKSENVIATANRDDVDYPEDSLKMVKLWLAAAKNTQDLVADRLEVLGGEPQRLAY